MVTNTLIPWYYRMMELLGRLNCLKHVPFFGLVIGLTLFSCQNNQRINFNQISTLDFEESLKLIDNEKDPVHWVHLLELKLSYLTKDSTYDPKMTRALGYLNQRSLAEKNSIGQNLYDRLISYRFVTIGQIDSAILYAQMARLNATLHDSIDRLITYQCLGVAYYYQNQNSDSTRKYWQKGYKEAVLTKNNLMIELFASNLGSFYYNNGNTRSARNLFLIASEAGLKIKRPNSMLINNIICTLMDESEFNQADTFWIKNQQILNEDLSTYNGQLYLLNRVKLLHELNRYDEANTLLASCKIQQLKPILRKEFIWVTLSAQFAAGNFSGFQDSFFRPIIQSNTDYFAFHLKNKLQQHIKRTEIQTFLNTIYSYYSDSSQYQSLSKIYKAKICELLATYQQLSNQPLAIKFYKSAIQLHSESIQEEKKEQLRTIEELDQLDNQFKEIKNKEEIISQQNQRQQVTLSLFGFVVVIVILGIWATRNYLKIKNIQQKQLQTEQNALLKEKELDNRIVEYSKSVIERNEKIKKEILNTIKTIPNDIKFKINQVFRDHFISAPFAGKENPKIANQLIKEKDDWNIQYPGFNDLNKTEKRVMVLTMENYRPKEIANVLGVSTQYVRNVKSRLKTKLNLKEDWGA